VSQADKWRVQVNIHLRVEHFGSLILNSFDHRRVAVAGIGYANAAGKVQVLLAVNRINMAALAPLDH
jgi:hypothetical protein